MTYIFINLYDLTYIFINLYDLTYIIKEIEIYKDMYI